MLEASYEPVPRTWYLAIGISMLLAAIYVVTFYPMQLPIWGLLLSLCIALVFLPACGIIAATTGTVIGLNVITEFIAGLLLPGQPIANVTFKVSPTFTKQMDLSRRIERPSILAVLIPFHRSQCFGYMV